MDFTYSLCKLALANIALTSLKIARFWQSRGLWKALEELYKLIATIIKCERIKGRKGRIYFLLAFKSRFTVTPRGKHCRIVRIFEECVT